MATATKQNPTETTYALKAVIDVGSTSIRMVVAQVYDDGRVVELDALNQSVAIGSDTFTQGKISRSTTEDCVKVLRNFSAVLAEYHVDLRTDVRAVATSAVREARNRDEFLDRIYIATGINVVAIEGTEVNRLTFLGIKPLLADHPELREGHLLVAEVGGGSTELLGLDEGRVAFAHTYRMGAYRLRETLDQAGNGSAPQMDVLEMEIEAGVRQCRDAAGEAVVNPALLLMGGEARLAARLLLKDWNEAMLGRLKVKDLSRMAEEVLHTDVAQISGRYNLSFEEALGLGPALKIYCRLAKAFNLKEVCVCGVTLRDGLLEEVASGNVWSEDFVEQIIGSVREIGRKYHQDEAHAECVTGNALEIFRALSEEHGLGYRYEVILTVAALLHEVGMFIGSSSHHKHSKYLIENSDIFGLSEEDIQLAAVVARYHRRAVPKPSHSEFSQLSREGRLVVSKLAAILRTADALDRSHTQSIRPIKVSLKEGQLVVEASRKGEFAAEKRALASKAKMFEQVYGRTVVLRTRRKQG